MPFAWALLGCGEPLTFQFGLIIFVPVGLCLLPPKDFVKFATLKESEAMLALLLVVPIMQVIITHHILLLLPALTACPWLTAATTVCEVCVYLSYAKLLRADPGFLVGGSPEHAKQYWQTLEALPPGSAPPEQFDDRAEALLPPRAHFSAMAGGAIREMDHDCPWIGGPVGQGNQVPFVCLLIFGDLALLGHVFTCVFGGAMPRGVLHPTWIHAWMLEVGTAMLSPIAYFLQPPFLITPKPRPPSSAEEPVLMRVVGLSMVLALVLVCLITPLLSYQLRFIGRNVLTVEHLRWQRHHPDEPTPLRGEDGWHEYAPHDLGSFRANLVAFVRGTRTARGGRESKAV